MKKHLYVKSLSSIFYPLSSIFHPPLLVWLLALPAITPLIQPTLTRSADGLLHLYRLVALDHLIRQGVFFSRWLPDLAYGYGLPLFIFYAPLSYYLTEELHLLGLDVVSAFNASAALALLVAGTGVYLWLKDLFGASAGVLAGVAYVYAPYQLFNTFSRGSLPALFRVGLALALALGLAAFFWLPATWEKDFAQVQRVITPPDFDYHANFVSPDQFFSLPRPANTGLLNPTDPLTLGLAQVGLAAIGLPAIFLRIWRQRNSRELKGTQGNPPLLLCSPAPLLFASISLAVAIFMMLPISVGVWDRLPFIAFVQQPHRLLSVTAFLLAVLAGAGVAALPKRLSFGLTLAGVVLIFITAVPLLYPRYYEALPAPPTLVGMMAYEHATGAIGTTSFGEYMPIWVQQTPHESPLEPLYQSGAPIERLDRAYLPTTANVESAVYGFNQVDLTINAAQPYQAVFHTFYFPGWHATVDGQPAPLAPVTERGLIGVSLPAGQHQLRLAFGETPIRLAANGLSLIALIVIIVLAVKTVSFHPSSFIPHPSSFILHPSPFSPSQFATLIALALTLILTKTLYLDRYDNPLKHVFDGANVAGVDVARQVNFGHQVNLLGYDLSDQTVASGQPFNLTLYWQARQPLTTNYSALTQLVDEQQHLYAGQDNLHPGNLPTRRWEPWGFVQDRHLVRVPPGTPPGDYFLIAGPYDPTTWARLPVIAGGDSDWRDVMAIPVKVAKPAQPPPVSELGIVWPMTKQIPRVSSLRLLGATPEREAIQRNDSLRVALFWEAVSRPAIDYQISLRLVTGDGVEVLNETSPPSFGRYPTSHWIAGERVRDNHAMWIPADFPAGAYRVQVQLLDEAGQLGGDWVEVVGGRITVEE
ncbi:MAG: hypothetical protein HYR94_17815 [Chloroflexi bacterium]|nr:hypothetical protein [Chloroflexota bacterium]